MNKEQLEVFKKIIYEPYFEAWTILASLRNADLDDQKVWDEWMKKCDLFYEKHPTEYAHNIYRVMLDAGDYIKDIWDNELQ